LAVQTSAAIQIRVPAGGPIIRPGTQVNRLIALQALLTDVKHA
jgi:hypothetical protein